MLKIISHPFKITHLRLNKLVKYKRKSIFIKEFYRVAFMTLIISNGQLKSYD